MVSLVNNVIKEITIGFQNENGTFDFIVVDFFRAMKTFKQRSRSAMNWIFRAIALNTAVLPDPIPPEITTIWAGLSKPNMTLPEDCNGGNNAVKMRFTSFFRPCNLRIGVGMPWKEFAPLL